MGAMEPRAGHYDVVVIGAGPTGLAIGLEARARRLTHLLIDKGTLVNTIVGYPTNMTFFSTPELLELGDMPFTTPGVRPSRVEAIEYYRGVARAGKLNVWLYNRVLSVESSVGGFLVRTEKGEVRASRVILATGYFDNPNPFDVPGSTLPKVRQYYHEPFEYFDRNVVVVGGRNSAVEAALDLWRHGARVTLVHRGSEIGPKVKYWVLPDIQNRIKRGEIEVHLNSLVDSITADGVRLRNIATGAITDLRNDAIFALIGYRPDVAMLEACGVAYDPETLIPVHNPDTFETNVPGLYIAGSVGCGCRTWEIFIENGRHHASVVVADIAARLEAMSRRSVE